MEIKKLARMVYNHTAEWAKEYGLVLPELTEEQEKWKNFFNENSTNSANASFSINLVEALTNSDLSFLKNKPKEVRNFVLYSVIVPTKNQNSHSYTLGEAVVCVDSQMSYFVRKHGTVGNHMDRNTSTFRLPQPEEIERLLGRIRSTNKTVFRKLENFMREKYDETTV